jgi:hypothetical protein
MAPVPEVFDATLLASPRIRVFNPEALHINYQTDWCPAIEDTREAALDPLQGGDPNMPEPLTNLIDVIHPNTNKCVIEPFTGKCRRVCNPTMGTDNLQARSAALQACNHWNMGETVVAILGPTAFGFGGGRNFCNRVGVNSSRSLDINPPDTFTDSYLGGDPLTLLLQAFDPPFISDESIEPAMPAEILVPMIKLYTVAFVKKFLEGDGRSCAT